LFLIKIKEFQNLNKQNITEVINQAKLIYNMFLTEDSEFELNITQTTVKPIKEILANYESISVDLFDKIAFEVNWMLSDSFDRFQRQQEFLQPKKKKKHSSFLNRVSRIIGNDLNVSQSDITLSLDDKQSGTSMTLPKAESLPTIRNFQENQQKIKPKTTSKEKINNRLSPSPIKNEKKKYFVSNCEVDIENDDTKLNKLVINEADAAVLEICGVRKSKIYSLFGNRNKQ